MTTVICTKDGMAADKRISGSPVFKSTKIHQVRGSLIGIAGNVEQALRFIEWRRTPEQKPQFDASTGFEALELTADRRLIWWGAEMVGIEIEDDYYAIGSGGATSTRRFGHGRDASASHQDCREVGCSDWD